MTDTSEAASRSLSSSAPPGRLVAFLGAKGGVGCTLLAAHVGAVLAEHAPWTVLDFDFCKGDLAAVLDLPTERSMSMLLDIEGAPAPEVVDAALQPHDSGIRAIVQPYDLSALHHIESDDAERILATVRARAAGVLVDAGSRIDVATLTSALLADDLVVVTTPDVPSLRDAQRVLQLLAALKVPQRKVRLVVNRMRNGRIPADEIARQLRIEVAAVVRDDPTSCERLDRTGQLAFAEAPRGAFAVDARAVAGMLLGDHTAQPAAPSRRWPWSRA